MGEYPPRHKKNGFTNNKAIFVTLLQRTTRPFIFAIVLNLAGVFVCLPSTGQGPMQVVNAVGRRGFWNLLVSLLQMANWWCTGHAMASAASL